MTTSATTATPVRQTIYALAALALLLGLIGLASTIPPADSEASSPITDTHGCPWFNMCGWQHANFGGERQATPYARETLGFANDEYSSIMNRRSTSAWFHEHTFCGGQHTWLRANHQIANLNNGWWFDQNDEISSVHSDHAYNAHSHCD